MNVYVAAKFEEADRVRSIYKQLEESGVKITHDWTGESAEKMTGPDGDKYKSECAMNDFKGVKKANVVLVLNHERLYGGAAEMGMAIAWGKKVFVVGSDVRYNIFFSLPNGMVTLFPSVDEAVAKIKEIAHERD